MPAGRTPLLLALAACSGKFGVDQPQSTGGASSSSSSSSSSTSSGSSSSSSGGGAGGATPCGSCAEAAKGLAPPCWGIDKSIYGALMTCACVTAGCNTAACTTECAAIQPVITANSPCLDCVAKAGTDKCKTAFNDCEKY